MFKWFKKAPPKPEPDPIEDVTGIRNIQEKLAGIKMGNAFGLTTREGIKIFKYVQLRPHTKGKNDRYSETT